MTALAMIIGMLPMSLGLGEGGEQNAPLGRAVIGGLVAATVATLFFVPVVYSVFRRRAPPSGRVGGGGYSHDRAPYIPSWSFRQRAADRAARDPRRPPAPRPGLTLIAVLALLLVCGVGVLFLAGYLPRQRQVAALVADADRRGVRSPARLAW